MRIKFKAIFLGTAILFSLIGFARVSTCQDDEMTWFNKANENISNEEKVICYMQAVRINPKFIEAYYNLGLVYKALEEYKKAGNALQKALSVDPVNLADETRVQIITELGIVQKNLKLYNQALETLNTARNLAREIENQSRILYELGQVKLLLGEFSEAIDYFNEGMLLNSSNHAFFAQALEIAQNKRDTQNNYERGIYFFDQGQYEEAVQALKKVVDANPGYKDAYSKLVEAQNLRDQRLEVDQLSLVYDRAIGFMRNEDWQNSIQTFQQIVQVDSNYKDVGVQLAEVKKKYNQIIEVQAYEKIYAEAISAYTERDWRTALTKFAEVLTWNPNFKDAKTWHLNTQAKLQSNRNDSRIFRPDDATLVENSESLIPEIQIDYGSNQIKENLTTNQNEKEMLPVEPDNFDRTDFAYASVQKTVHHSISETQHRNIWFVIAIILSITIVPAGISFFAVPKFRAKLFLLLRNYSKAASIYEGIISKNPNHSKFYLTLAQIYLVQNRTDYTALRVYQFVLQLYENPPMKETIKEIISQKDNKKNKKSMLDILGKDLLKELHNMGAN